MFIDEAGSLAFKQQTAGQRKKALAFVAVAVPTLEMEDLVRILPRGRCGKFLKAQDPEFHPGLALPFVEALIASNAEVGAFFADPGDRDNVERAKQAVQLANANRAAAREREATPEGRRNHPDISEHDLLYLLFLRIAVTTCLSSVLQGRGMLPASLDVVIDSMTIDEHHRKKFQSTFREVYNQATPRTELGRFEWMREQDEPLLLLPDLVGGIICREDRYRDVGAAAARIWEVERRGRFTFQNKPPSQTS